MELLQFLKDEGYSETIVHDQQSRPIYYNLNDISDDMQLFSKLNIQPVRIEYFPFDARPNFVSVEESRKQIIYVQKGK